jgi:proliferating cell nuclear antigen PCNA
MPLSEYEYEEMNIPVVDYDAEFSLSSKQISDMFSQLNNFGNDIIVNCSETSISLTTNGITGEMRVDIPIDDLSSYSIVEGEDITLTYSLAYINKMCITNKLSSDVEFSLSNDCPMKISYDLGDDSSMIFFIAPKMND